MVSTVNIPSLVTPDVQVTFWNIDRAVGSGALTHGMDVKLCQYLLYAFTNTRGSRFPLADVIGVWGPKSTAVLSTIEKERPGKFRADGLIDPIRPGQTQGSISHTQYKLLNFQESYALIKLGLPSTDFARAIGVNPQDISDALMKMPEEPDMPGDLGGVLKTLRDG